MKKVRKKYCKQCGNEIKRVIIGNMNPNFCSSTCRAKYSYELDLDIRRKESELKRLKNEREAITPNNKYIKREKKDFIL